MALDSCMIDFKQCFMNKTFLINPYLKTNHILNRGIRDEALIN